MFAQTLDDQTTYALSTALTEITEFLEAAVLPFGLVLPIAMLAVLF